MQTSFEEHKAAGLKEKQQTSRQVSVENNCSGFALE